MFDVSEKIQAWTISFLQSQAEQWAPYIVGAIIALIAFGMVLGSLKRIIVCSVKTSLDIGDKCTSLLLSKPKAIVFSVLLFGLVVPSYLAGYVPATTEAGRLTKELEDYDRVKVAWRKDLDRANFAEASVERFRELVDQGIREEKQLTKELAASRDQCRLIQAKYDSDAALWVKQIEKYAAEYEAEFKKILARAKQAEQRAEESDTALKKKQYDHEVTRFFLHSMNETLKKVRARADKAEAELKRLRLGAN